MEKVEKEERKVIEGVQEQIVEQLEEFTSNLTGQIRISNDLIKDLSIHIFEVISFYKEILSVWKQDDSASEANKQGNGSEVG